MGMIINYYTYLILASPDNVKRFFEEGICTGQFVVQKWDEFSKDYIEQNRPVTEYKLNLTTDEVRHLWMNLDKETYNPKKRIYSFLHSQCTSICADIIRGSLHDERIEYGYLPEALTGTLRDYTDYAVSGYPWYRFCFQCLLGAEGEEQGTIWEKLTPTEIWPIWSQASIVDAEGNEYEVIDSTLTFKVEDGVVTAVSNETSNTSGEGYYDVDSTTNTITVELHPSGGGSRL